MSENVKATQKDKLEAALKYLDMGFSVIPVGKSKKPIIQWKEFQDRYATEQEVKKWFKAYPKMDIGIVTGKISKIVVIDVEVGGETDSLPPGVIAKSGGGGFHFYYLYPNQHVNNAVRIRDRMDIRGDGGFVVAPPSSHPSGGQYEWVASPFHADLTELPIWVMKELKKGQKQDWVSIFSTDAEQGKRNETLTKVAGKIISGLPDILWDTEGWQQISQWNEDHCKPPLTDEEVNKILNSIKLLKQQELAKRGANIQNNKKKQITTIEAWQEEIKANFPDLTVPAEIGLSIVVQLKIIGLSNPFACVYVGPPSSGKTITLNFFDRFEGITYATDKFSPAAFVTHAANVKEENLEKIDLLPRIKNKVMLVRDMTTIFTQPDEKLKENLGIMTRVLDGEGLEIDSGSRGQRGYHGKHVFMLLGATTDGSLTERLWNLLGSLGSRIFFVHMPDKDKTIDELVTQLGLMNFKDKEEHCRNATLEFVRSIWDQYPNGIAWDKSKDSVSTLTLIARIAKTLARLRGVVAINTTFYDDEKVVLMDKHSIEQPDRINQLLYNFACGHAVIKGRNYICEEDESLVAYVALQSAQVKRRDIFIGLIKNNGCLTTEEVEKILGKSKPMACLFMDTFEVLGLCTIEKVKDAIGRPKKTIVLSDEYKFLRV